MKKTIVTLMALVGSVFAAGVETWDLTLSRNGGGNSITSGNSDLWAGEDGMVVESFLMEFTVDKFTSGGYNVCPINTSRGTTNTATERQGITFLAWETTNVGIGNGKTHYNADDNKMTFAAGDSMRLAFDAEAETAYLYNVTKSTLCTYDMSSVITEDNASLYYFTSGVKGTEQTLGSTCVWTDGTANHFTFGKLHDVSAMAGTAQFKEYVKTLQVPEPATATLSLLALAGLAARRRRK